MLVIKRGTKRHFDVKWATALVVLTLFVFLVEPNVIGQTKEVEEHLAELKKRIDDVSRPPDTPNVVTLHGKKEWHCASAALRRTGDAIEWVGVEEGIKKTFAAALKAVADIASLGGATRFGTVGEILSAYAESETLQQFTQKLGEMAALKAFGKVLPEKLDETQRELIKNLAEKIWKALGGEKGPTSIVKIWEDPVCGNINITLRITTEGVTEAPPPKPREENLVQKNCEKRCGELRDKWESARRAAIASEGEAKAQEEKLAQARGGLDGAKYSLTQANTRLVKAKADWEANKKSMVLGKREQSRLDLAQAEANVSNQQREVNRLTGEIDRLTRSAPEARASATKQSKTAKDAEDAYRMCLKDCYDAVRKLAISPRDKEDLEKLQDPLKTPVEELLASRPPPETSEPLTKSSRKKFLHFEATGDCHCKFPKNYPDDERLGSFGVVGEAELIPQNPVVEGKTIAINYKLDTVKFDVVASCGCKTAAKSETAIPTETRTQTQSAKPISQTEQKSETASYYLPSGMLTLNPDTAPAWWSSPFAPLGDCPCYYCCCNHDLPIPIFANANRPDFVSVRLSQAMDRLGVGRSIHVSYSKGGYLAETYLQWAASGGPGLTVDLEVLRPRSNTFEKLATGRGTNDAFFFETKIPGAYLFRATAKDSSGKSSFNTLSVTFPFIDTESQSNPK